MHFASPLLLALVAAFAAPSPNLIRVSDMAPRYELSRFPLVGSMPHTLTDERADFRSVLHIDRDYGPSAEDIAIDAWVSKDGKRLEEVRIWWVRQDVAGRRAPFSKRVLKRLNLGYMPVSDQQWFLGFAGDGKQFVFSVEMEGGKPVLFGDVDTENGTVGHCRVQRARIVAKRVLGVPSGLSHMEVTCIDAGGKRHHGQASWREV